MLVKFILRCVIGFDIIVKRTDLTSPIVCLKHASTQLTFCFLILCPTTSLNFFILTSFGGILGFFYIQDDFICREIIAPAPFRFAAFHAASSSCLSALTGTPGVTSDSSRENGYPNRFLIWEEQVSASHLERDVAAGFYLWHRVKVHCLCPQFMESLIRKGYRVLSNAFFFWDNHIFYSIIVIYLIYWSMYLKPPLHPRKEFHLIMLHDPVNVLLNLIG